MDRAIETPSNTQVIDASAYRRMPWRNGLGTTVELLKLEAADGGGFAWRLSMADVAQDGEFSNFSGYDRTLLLLEGNGISLDCDGEVQHLDKPLQSAGFSGDATTIARLHDGPIKDFNIMTRRDLCAAAVSSQEGADPVDLQLDADLLLVYAVDAGLRVALGSGEHRLAAQQLLVVHEPGRQTMRCRGSGFIATQIRYRARAS